MQGYWSGIIKVAYLKLDSFLVSDKKAPNSSPREPNVVV